MNDKIKPVASGVLGALFSSIFGVVVLLLGLFLLLIYMFGYVVSPGQMGVRQITFGPSQGFSQKGLKPGYHWSIPIYSKIHFIPETIQQMHLHRDRSLYSKSPGALEVQTTDGSSVDVDMSIWYHFFDQSAADHGGPAQLLQQVGSGIDWTAHIQTAVINELKKSLGRLSTSQFYNPTMREEEIAVAKDEMNKRLNKDGIKIEVVLLRRYTYKEERIDQAIFQKNLQDQEERLNAAASKLAEAKAVLEKVSAEWDAKIKTLEVQGDNRAKVIHSEADLYEKKRVAEGDLLVAKAGAEVEKKKANVLAETEGSEIFIAKELAPLLASLKGGMVEEIDPYNLEEWMKRLGIGRNSKQ